MSSDSGSGSGSEFVDAWPKESIWERRIVPFLGQDLAPRQLAWILGGVMVGALAAWPIPGMLGKAGAFILFFIIGFVLANVPVRTVPLEVQLMRALRHRGGGVPIQPAPAPGAPTPQPTQPTPAPQAALPLPLPPGVPLTIAGEVRTDQLGKVVLRVDGEDVAHAAVGPGAPDYRFTVDLAPGVHRLEVLFGGRVVMAQDVKVG